MSLSAYQQGPQPSQTCPQNLRQVSSLLNNISARLLAIRVAVGSVL